MIRPDQMTVHTVPPRAVRNVHRVSCRRADRLECMNSHKLISYKPGATSTTTDSRLALMRQGVVDPRPNLLLGDTRDSLRWLSRPHVGTTMHWRRHEHVRLREVPYVSCVK